MAEELNDNPVTEEAPEVAADEATAEDAAAEDAAVADETSADDVPVGESPADDVTAEDDATEDAGDGDEDVEAVENASEEIPETDGVADAAAEDAEDAGTEDGEGTEAADDADSADAEEAADDEPAEDAEADAASPDDAAKTAENAQKSAESEGDAEPAEDDPGTVAVKEFAASLKTLPGKWYTLHTYSGYEKRVKSNLESRIETLGLQDQVFQVEIPTEEVEKRSEKGKKIVTQVRFPGYVLVRMTDNEDARRKVRDTEGVTGFVGTVKSPIPLSARDVVSMLAPMIRIKALKDAGQKAEANKHRIIEVSYKVGDAVTIKSGSFDSMPGVVSEVHSETQKLSVLVSMFGRDTPVELGFDQVQKDE